MSFVSDAAGKVIVTLVGASIIGLAGAVINTTRTNAEQEVKIKEQKERSAQADETLRKLDDSVRQIDRSVAVLNERLRKD